MQQGIRSDAKGRATAELFQGDDADDLGTDGEMEETIKADEQSANRPVGTSAGSRRAHEDNRFGGWAGTQPPKLNQLRPLPSFLPVVEEPICVLKIELDGEHIEEIKVFENDDPAVIVAKFGDDFNLSQNAR